MDLEGRRRLLLDSSPPPGEVAPQTRSAVLQQLRALYPGCTAEWVRLSGRWHRTPRLDLLRVGWGWGLGQ